ncbi:MAG: hypothetical protein HDR28_06675 [Lachnospiraceae bacterium]|nr:hypothetical protein [Lachnospiraceae bacterium]
MFCLKITDEVINRANKLYDKQIAIGKITKYCCDFKVLEKIADMQDGGNNEKHQQIRSINSKEPSIVSGGTGSQQDAGTE